MREVISTSDAPSSPLYSQAVKAGDHVYVSGVVGVDVTTGNLAGSTIQEQTRQALTNCQAVLHAAPELARRKVTSSDRIENCRLSVGSAVRTSTD